jgi:hypothetical protein
MTCTLDHLHFDMLESRQKTYPRGYREKQAVLHWALFGNSRPWDGPMNPSGVHNRLGSYLVVIELGDVIDEHIHKVLLGFRHSPSAKSKYIKLSKFPSLSEGPDVCTTVDMSGSVMKTPLKASRNSVAFAVVRSRPGRNHKPMNKSKLLVSVCQRRRPFPDVRERESTFGGAWTHPGVAKCRWLRTTACKDQY